MACMRVVPLQILAHLRYYRTAAGSSFWILGDMAPSPQRKRFRDQSVAGIVLHMLATVGAQACSPTLRLIRLGSWSSAETMPDSTLRPTKLIVVAVAAAATLVGYFAIVEPLAMSASSSGPPAQSGTYSTPGPTAAFPVVQGGSMLVPLLQLGVGGASPVQFLQPQDALFGTNDRIYIADTGHHRVVVFDMNGNLKGTITQGATGPLQAPFSLALASDANLLVLDSDAGRIFEYTSAGRLVRASPPGLSFAHARGIAVGAQGQVYVAHPAADAVYTLTSDLQTASAQPSVDNGVELYNQPSGIAVGPDRSLFVVDSQNNRVEQFSAGWQLLSTWAVRVPDTVHSPHLMALSGSRLLMSDPADGKLLLFHPGSTQPAVFALPSGSEVPLGIAGDRHGDFLVTCNGSSQVLEVKIPGA
jgi:DNA-binding beta-propeller fold protein YncE